MKKSKESIIDKIFNKYNISLENDTLYYTMLIIVIIELIVNIINIIG